MGRGGSGRGGFGDRWVTFGGRLQESSVEGRRRKAGRPFDWRPYHKTPTFAPTHIPLLYRLGMSGGAKLLGDLKPGPSSAGTGLTSRIWTNIVAIGIHLTPTIAPAASQILPLPPIFV